VQSWSWSEVDERRAQEIAPCLSSLSCALGTGRVATTGWWGVATGYWLVALVSESEFSLGGAHSSRRAGFLACFPGALLGGLCLCRSAVRAAHAVHARILGYSRGAVWIRARS
jgi:hypothetical protein